MSYARRAAFVAARTPNIVLTNYGMWLATSPVPELGIGVIGLTSSEARERYDASLRRRSELLEILPVQRNITHAYELEIE
jgi:hypothetical protein